MARASGLLSTVNHDRDVAGLTYVYPVISRRAGGVSVGVNLNPNNACNWRCAYCQVPDLSRGVAPNIDLAVLRDELHRFLDDALHGDFMAERVPEDCRHLRDIAISGNGEPTSSRQFDRVVELIGEVVAACQLIGKIKLVLITNGSYVRKPHVQAGLARLKALGGEVWIKLDAATDEGIQRINGISMTPARLRRNIEIASALCPTWIQTCLFAWDDQPPAEAEQQAYLDFLRDLKRDDVPLEGVLLYGIARPSMQPGGDHLSPLPLPWLKGFAKRIERLGHRVRLSP